MPPATLLVVDADPELRDALALALREEGYRLLMAGSAVEALVHLAAGPVEVVLSDDRIPGLDGKDLLQIVRERHPDAVRVVLTGHLDPVRALAAIDAGDCYRPLAKPVDPFELRVTLRLALEKLALERELRRLSARAPG
jgi:DNA-binding NtrC family response regulator